MTKRSGWNAFAIRDHLMRQSHGPIDFSHHRESAFATRGTSRTGRAVSSTRYARDGRSGCAYRDDGGRGRSPPAMDDARALPRHARRLQPDSRAQLDRDGDSHRATARRIRGTGRRGRMLHSSRRRDRARDRVDVRAIRHDAASGRAAVRHQAGDHRSRTAGAVGTRPHRDQVATPRRARDRCADRLAASTSTT